VKETESECPSKGTFYICKKRGSIRIMLEDWENPDSDSEGNMPKSGRNRDSDGSLCDGLAKSR